MIQDGLKLTTYFGERDRVGDRFLADALTDLYADRGLQTSLVLRGIEGFGHHHHLRTDRLLTLSEDLPIVSVAVDTRETIQALVPEVERLCSRGLVTLERARLITGAATTVDPVAGASDAKLTVYVGRQERLNGRPAYEAIVALLHERGVAGATVLLGIDGTAHGVRERAAFFSRNAAVPLMIIAVGEGKVLASVAQELQTALPRPLMTLERVQVRRRDGLRLPGADEPLPTDDGNGLQVHHKVMVYASEQSRHDGHPLHHLLVRRLREAGAAGATTLRGIWGYHGDHRPHGDSFWQLRRRVPVVCVIVDTPERTHRWLAIVDEVTDRTGLVTAEVVPARQP